MLGRAGGLGGVRTHRDAQDGVLQRGAAEDHLQALQEAPPLFALAAPLPQGRRRRLAAAAAAAAGPLTSDLAAGAGPAGRPALVPRRAPPAGAALAPRPAAAARPLAGLRGRPGAVLRDVGGLEGVGRAVLHGPLQVGGEGLVGGDAPQELLAGSVAETTGWVRGGGGGALGRVGGHTWCLGGEPGGGRGSTGGPSGVCVPAQSWCNSPEGRCCPAAERGHVHVTMGTRSGPSQVNRGQGRDPRERWRPQPYTHLSSH